MKRVVVVPGKPIVRYLIIAAFTGLLVGCGGGSSGDSDDDIDLDLDPPIFDPDDVDGDGIPNSEDSDFDPFDLDNDGILNINDDDVDGDGILNEFDEDFVPGDADGDGFTDPSPSTPCGSENGTDSNSSTATWDDNCTVERTSANGQFADSLYAAGIQRVVFCSGFGDGADFAAFADGEFGPLSEAATQDFQSANGLTPDGIVGPQTWGVMQDAISLLQPGTAGPNGIAQDVYGFDSGRCAGTPLFYQSVQLSGTSIIEGGWTLALNPPNSDEMVEFSTALPFGRL